MARRFEPFSVRLGRSVRARPLLVLGVCALLSACGGGENEPAETPPSTGTESTPGTMLRVAVPAVPIVIDPMAPKPAFHLSLVPYLYPSLLVTERSDSAALQSRGDLATRWNWHEDHRLVLDLGPRTWSDGSAIDEADVLEAFRLHLSRAESRSKGLLEISSSRPGQVELQFADWVPEWRALQIASLPIFPIDSREPGSARAGRSEPVSGGRLRIGERDARGIQLVPNESSPTKMHLSGVSLEMMAAADTRLLRVNAGLSDVALNIPVPTIRDLGVGEEVVLHDAGPGSVEMLCWNLRLDELGQPLREAVSLAIDRSRIAEIFCDEDTCHGGPAYGLLDPESEPIRSDRARAERLVPSESPRVIRMLYDGNNEVRERIATYLEEDLAHIGIQLRPIALDGPEVLRRFRAGEFEVVLLGFAPSETPDCGDLWTSDGAWNGMGFRDARVDSLCEEVRRAPSPGRARELILEMERQVRRKMPVTFLVHRRRIDAVSRQLSGFDGTTWRPLGSLQSVTRLRAPAGESRMTAASPREEAR